MEHQRLYKKRPSITLSPLCEKKIMTSDNFPQINNNNNQLNNNNDIQNYLENMKKVHIIF